MKSGVDAVEAAVADLRLGQANAMALQQLIERRLAQHEQEIHDGMERALGLVPRLLRGAVRKLLSL